MKKFTFLTVAAMTAMAANAQYTVNPETSVVAAQKPAEVAWIVLDAVGQEDLTKAGATLINMAPDDVNKFFYIWENTFAAGDGSYPGVDGGEDQYLSLEVGSVGWSGGGYFISGDAGIDLSCFNDDTRFHVAYMTPSDNGPASVALVICDGDNEGSSPAKIAVGNSFDDGGNIYPTIGPALNDDWQGVDISFADLKKMYPSFALATDMKNWQGNIVSILGGGVEGKTLALDCLYFYNLAASDAGVDGVAVDNACFVVTGKTINLNGANGIELYDMGGKLVKKTAGCVLGIDNLSAGVYVAKSGKLVHKVVVK